MYTDLNLHVFCVGTLIHDQGATSVYDFTVFVEDDVNKLTPRDVDITHLLSQACIENLAEDYIEENEANDENVRADIAMDKAKDGD